MKKVIITTRGVYHKIASVTVDVPAHISEDKLQSWLWNNEHLFISELDAKFHKAEYNYGFGVDEDNGMDWADEPSETRYDLVEKDAITFGGHL